MENICKKELCTGCWACHNACPKQCIEMKEGELLHLYPTINQKTCIDCGVCQKTCPAINPLPKEQPLKTYAAWAKDEEEYKTSTSGGLGAVLSREILKAGGVVYGCAVCSDIDIHHIRITKEEDIALLKGSKYVQSSIHDSHQRVKQDLRDGRQVLFTGTPCQIAGLKRYLKKDYANLYLVDLICHGVPSLGYLKQHITDVTHSEVKDIDSIRFREGNGMYLIVVNKDDEKEEKKEKRSKSNRKNCWRKAK